VVLHEGAVAGQRVLVVPIGGMGNAGAAQAAQQAVDVWNPARLVLTGIVGGIPAGGDDLRLGDVLVPDQVVGYEPGKLTADGEQHRYDVHRPDAGLLAAARAMPAREWVHTVTVPRPDGTDGRELPRVHIGPVLSGEKVIADAGALPGVAAAWPKAVGVEMESFGVALAAYRGGPAFLMVKAVSDLRDAAKDDRWRRYACDVAARFVVALLARSPAAPAPARPQSVPAGEPARFSGAAKLDVCRRLDNWRELADVFEVPDWEIARFPHGEQARALWGWLEARGKLAALPAALDDIGRPDLAGRLRADARPVR
jgi:nucleoside phosphorylase